MEDCKKIKFAIYADDEFLSSQNLRKWFETMVFFEPDRMRGKRLANSTVKFNRKKLLSSLDTILSENGNFNIRLSNDFNSFSFWRYSAHYSIICSLSTDIYDANKDVLLKNIDAFFKDYGGIVAYACSSEDYFWQNLYDLNYYKSQGRNVDGLHITKRDVSDETFIIDTEYNPGHSHYPLDLWFGSCWAMWFGDKYFQYIPKEILRSFRDCYENTELEDGSVRILLHEDVWDFDAKENRDRQWSFRKQVGIDETAHQMLNMPIITNGADVSIELLNGNFEHGGIKKINYYFDKNGKVVPKYKAIECRTYEFDKDGKVVWSDIKQIV